MFDRVLRRGELMIVCVRLAVKLQLDWCLCVLTMDIIISILQLKLIAYLFCISASEIVIFFIKIDFVKLSMS